MYSNENTLNNILSVFLSNLYDFFDHQIINIQIGPIISLNIDWKTTLTREFWLIYDIKWDK